MSRTIIREPKLQKQERLQMLKGRRLYEVEVNKKDLIFDEKGNFVKAED